MVKNLPLYAGDVGLIPELGRSPGEGNSNLLQYSCLENPMDRGAWWATQSMGSQSQTRPLHDKFWYYTVLITVTLWSVLTWEVRVLHLDLSQAGFGWLESISLWMLGNFRGLQTPLLGVLTWGFHIGLG